MIVDKDLLAFTRINFLLEVNVRIDVIHKETESKGVYFISSHDKIDSIIIDFYCFIKKISWYEFNKLFTQFKYRKMLDNNTLSIQHSLVSKRKIKLINYEYLPDFLKEPKPIRTQSELDNDRLTEIVDAIGRYRKAEMAIPTQWIEEYNTIIERIKNNPK